MHILNQLERLSRMAAGKHNDFTGISSPDVHTLQYDYISEWPFEDQETSSTQLLISALSNEACSPSLIFSVQLCSPSTHTCISHLLPSNGASERPPT